MLPQVAEPFRGGADVAPGRWLGVVLCGGASRRMGRDKARIELGGEPLYARAARMLGELCAEVVLASGPAARLGDPRWREVADAATAPVDGGAEGERPGQGPLAALVASLALAEREGFDGIVTAPCDVPAVTSAALAPLLAAVAGSGASADIAHWRRGERDEPLAAAFGVRAAEPLAVAFARGVRRPTEAFAGLRVAALAAPAAVAEQLDNVNTPEELAALIGRGGTACEGARATGSAYPARSASQPSASRRSGVGA